MNFNRCRDLNPVQYKKKRTGKVNKTMPPHFLMLICKQATTLKNENPVKYFKANTDVIKKRFPTLLIPFILISAGFISTSVFITSITMKHLLHISPNLVFLQRFR